VPDTRVLPDQVGAGHSPLDVALINKDAYTNISQFVIVKLRGSRFQRLFGIEYRCQNLILHMDEIKGLPGGVLVYGRHRRDFFLVVAHPVYRE
jgi:hypothetical protein